MKQILGHLKRYLFEPRFHFNRFQFNLVAIFFITTGLILGSYLALSNVIPKIFALNDTNKAWTFSTATATDYTYDSNLVTVDNTGAHPISTVNKFTNPAFASDNTSWSVAAVPASGWVEVPGNSTYSTTNFLSMKYEAKIQGVDSGSQTYNSSYAAESRATGTPWVNISQTNAIAECAALGSSYHLITNNEWMTIARNAEAVASNWTLGSVGSGYLYSGHNDNAPAGAKAASSTDTGNNRCAYTDTAGTTEAPSSCPTNTAQGTSGTAGNQVRVLTLSNSAPIWDLAGNVWEWTNDTIQGKDQPTSGSPGFGWREFTALTTYGTMSYDLVRPIATAYNSNYGVGQIYSDGTGSNTTTYGFLRGGNWANGASTGSFTLSLKSYA